MYTDKIICGITGKEGLKKLNEDIYTASRQGYKAVDISGTGNPEGEICVLLCKKA